MPYESSMRHLPACCRMAPGTGRLHCAESYSRIARDLQLVSTETPLARTSVTCTRPPPSGRRGDARPQHVPGIRDDVADLALAAVERLRVEGTLRNPERGLETSAHAVRSPVE